LDSGFGGQVEPPPFAAPFSPALAPRLLDEDAPHGFGGGDDKMPAVVPTFFGFRFGPTGRQPQIRLMNQGRRLKRLTRLFLSQFPRR
jgi:hypothetical protein